MEYNENLYTQFLYKATEISSDAELESLISGSGVSHNLAISDLSSMSESERTEELNSIISSERARFYYPGDPEYLLSIYKLAEKEYFFILSVCDRFIRKQKDSLKLMCYNLFHCFPEECSSLISSTDSSSKKSINYWSDLFGSLNVDEFKGVRRSVGEMNMTSFRADAEIETAFDKFVERGGSGSALCATVLGQMASHMLESPKVIVNQILTGTPLSSAPIILNNASSYGSSLREVIAQFRNVSAYCFCSRLDLYHAIGNRFINRVMISSGYSDPNMYTNLLRRMDPNVCYCQPAIDTLNSPLCVFTRRFENRMTLIYYYDSKEFESVDMFKFHESVCSLFRKALNLQDDAVISVDKNTITAQVHPDSPVPMTESERIRLKTARKMPIFKKYDDTELIPLMKDISFVRRSSRQYILASGEKVDMLYLICVGKVSVMGMGSNGFSNPLYFAGPGDMFGAESLTDDPVLRNSFMAYSDDVVLMCVNRDVIIRESRRHPEIMQYILSKQIDISTRFQKLWLTV